MRKRLGELVLLLAAVVFFGCAGDNAGEDISVGEAPKSGVGAQGPAGPAGPAGPRGEPGTPGEKPPLVLRAAKIHGFRGGRFLPATVPYSGAVEVPAVLEITEGLGASDSDGAALLRFDAVECRYNPASTAFSPLLSGDEQQMRLSVTYQLVDCSADLKAGDKVDVEKEIALTLRRADVYSPGLITRIEAVLRRN